MYGNVTDPSTNHDKSEPAEMAEESVVTYNSEALPEVGSGFS